MGKALRPNSSSIESLSHSILQASNHPLNLVVVSGNPMKVCCFNDGVRKAITQFLAGQTESVEKLVTLVLSEDRR
jgi:hypothetical protein